MTKDQAVSEERKTASSYIVNFYNEIENVTHHSAMYNNTLIELDVKYGENIEMSKVPEEEKQKLINEIHTVRYFVQKTYIKYITILKKTSTKVSKDFEKLYQEIMSDFIIQREPLQKYVVEINAILMDEIMKDLLETSREIVESLTKDKDDK